MAAMAVVGRLSLGLFVDRLDPRLACAASMTSQAAAPGHTTRESVSAG